MTRSIAAIAILIALTLTAGRATIAQDAADPAQSAEALTRGLLALEQNDVAEADKAFKQVIAAAPANSLPRHVAGVLATQITGEFAARESAWLDRKVVDTVVLVPDEAALIKAVGRWTDDRFWPVLIEDAWFTPMFIEAFKPARVVRWSPAPTPDEADEPIEKQVAKAVVAHNAAFNPPRLVVTPPPGLVVLDPFAPQRAAGYALARGHGQPVLMIKVGLHARGTTSADQATHFNARVMAALAAMDMIANGRWSAITLAGDYPYKYVAANDKNDVRSVDDRLGRDERLVRHAVAGRLIGSPTRTAYDAMCSLFIQPRRALLFNTYWHNPDWKNDAKSAYHLSDAAAKLNKSFDQLELRQNGGYNADDFRALQRAREPFDFVWINSAFGVDSLKTPDGVMGPPDMPTGHAYAMYMVASFGAADPWSNDHIIAACRGGGAFWYFGSVNEPYLNAFVQSTALALRATPGTPLALAAHQTPPYPFAKPWMLTCIGDPLYALRKKPAQRVDGPMPADTAPIADAPPEGATAAERMHAALLRRDIDTAVAQAQRAVDHAGDLEPDQLAQVMGLLFRVGDDATLSRIEPTLARRHTAAWMVHRRIVLTAERQKK